MSFREWVTYKTEEVISKEKKSLISGPFGSNIGRKYFVEDGIPVIRGNNLSLDKGVKLIDSGYVYVTEEKASELGTWAIKNDIVFTAAGTIGQVGMIHNSRYEKYIISNKQIRLRLNTEIVDPLFAYYWYSSDRITKEIINNNTGSSVPLINLRIIRSLNICLPSLLEQKNIAHILSTLDEKIEVNNQINKTLEKMAQAIFKQWFVDFEFPNEDGEPYQSSGGEMVESELGLVPKGWEVGILGDIIEITSGKRPPKRSDKKENHFTYPLVGASSVMGFSEEYNFNEAILVIGRVGTHGIVQRFDKKIWASDNTLVIKSKVYEYVYQILNKIDYSALNRGSTQPLITQTDIKNYSIVVPPLAMIDYFESIISSLFKSDLNNKNENEILKNIRDELLPKLMTGEIKVL